MIPFSPPYISEDAIAEVVKVLRSGWITTGPQTKQFETELSKYCGTSKVVCCSSGAFGLELILHWFGVKNGDEVIIPAYTYCATANVIEHTGAKIVMVDINEKDFTIDAEQVKKAISSKTKAIIPVDLGGLPCDYLQLYEIINSAEINALFKPETDEQAQLGRILLLTDAAHSLGAYYNNSKSGCISDVSVFSFHAVKNLTTAEGGAISLNLPDPFSIDEVYKKLNIMLLHGQSKDALSKTQYASWKYDVLTRGFKGNMTDIQAALGLTQLKEYDTHILKRRKEIFIRYSKFFGRYDEFLIPEPVLENRISSYHLYLLRVKDITEDERDKIIDLIFSNGVSVNVHYIPLPLLTAYNEYDIKNFPVSYNCFKNEITLPVYYTLTDDDIETICNVVYNSVKTIQSSNL